MAFDYAAATALLLEPQPAIAWIKGWNRLEGRPRAVNFERALRAEVRDPLWFLTRQWQFGEFTGDDAASPVDVRTRMSSAPFARYTPGTAAAVAYDAGVPLEARVEAERIPADLVTHVQVTRCFFGLVAGQARAALIRSLHLDPAAYGLAAEAVEGVNDADGRALLALSAGKLLDGARLIRDIRSGAYATRVAAFASLDAAERAALVSTGSALLAWWQRLYREPDAAEPSAWTPRALEYQFACATHSADDGDRTLVADTYNAGQLEWYAFDVDMAAPAPSPPAEAPSQPALSFIPAPVSFTGMPSPRYWEFEARSIDFAAIDANTTDLATLLLTEFALVYSNDWCVIPHEVDVGSLCALPGLLVTDDFGETTLVRAAGRGPDDAWQRWAMFTLSATGASSTADVDARLLVPPTLTRTLESVPVEEVLLLRDEMANMAWAVEKTVPAARGGGADGYSAQPAAAANPPVLHPTIAQARYVLGTDVPRNWHPFMPVHVPGSSRSVMLQRARLPGPDRTILGRVLAVPSPYYVNEEDVPRAGRVVRCGFRRARWAGGSTFLWLGRRVFTGRGEGSSGLAFDQVTDVRSDDG
jgi:hypothetical protein